MNRNELAIGMKIVVAIEFEHDSATFKCGAKGIVRSVDGSYLSILWDNDGCIDSGDQWNDEQDEVSWGHPASDAQFLSLPEMEWRQFLDL